MDMDVVPIARRIAISAISAFALFAHPVHADTRNFALVRCDEATGELIVKEDSTEDDVDNYKTPEGYQLKWLDDLVEYISPPGGATDDATSGTYRHKLRDWQLSCTLKGAVYSIVISPWSVNDMVMGECGGGDPDLALTVRRNKRLLVKDLQLGGTCSIGPNNAVVIEALKLSEPERVAMLDDRKIPYSEIPTLDRKKLRSTYSAADSLAVAAMPGMASNGYKCSETGLQQQMNACAELNFNAADKELNGVYKKLKASLTPTQQAALVQDERKWLKSLDAGCHKSANDEAEGGSMWPMVFWQCKADTTKLRVERLRDWEP
jgi:uncharacterized protein YecT (DUF1311 family)